ncbi:hypothetical protein JG688_00018590 [Phytophthora aleatoria]|uniref:RxLR effector protein n=1 Tax=Phytophthora aleatoria TaxID=2496075 RepID=A0A8J5M0J1_9STRA|nr:hypothetical protein JG688_00018590 [Phytophthora aleatoria]
MRQACYLALVLLTVEVCWTNIAKAKQVIYESEIEPNNKIVRTESVLTEFSSQESGKREERGITSRLKDLFKSNSSTIYDKNIQKALSIKIIEKNAQ